MTTENKFIIKKTSTLIFFIAFQLYLFTGCSPFRKGNELTKFESLQFSFQDPSNSRYFSILFSQSNTVFLKKYSHFNNDTVFYSILSDSDRSIINAFVISVNSSVFHPSKPDSIEASNPDKAKFSLYIDYSDENQYFDFDSLPPPIAFKKFNSWVNKIIEKLQFNYIESVVRLEKK